MRPHHHLLVSLAILCARPALGLCEDLDPPDPIEGEKPGGYVYENDYFSIQFGGGFIVDYARFYQDDDSEAQLDMDDTEMGIRDLRLLTSGKTPWSRMTYTLGYMYDAAKNSWRFRQTGLVIQIPELSAHVFLGRTKEGFSTNKLMVGYYGWMNERAAVNDAFIPILNDGVRWTGTAFGNHLVYNLGAFTDVIGHNETYSRNDWATAGRAVFLPFVNCEDKGVLHLAGELRYAGADEGLLQFKSKPEAFLAEKNAVDTGAFDASRTTIAGVEAYYVNGPFSSGGEYYFNWVSSDAEDNPFFHGGELFAAYMLTGETHPYNNKGATFGNVVPTTSFFKNGWGAWELVARGSYIDLDSKTIDGGKFARISAQVNWYISDAVRFEAVYGYGVLDRFALEGATQFIQTRVQLSIK